MKALSQRELSLSSQGQQDSTLKTDKIQRQILTWSNKHSDQLIWYLLVQKPWLAEVSSEGFTFTGNICTK